MPRRRSGGPKHGGPWVSLDRDLDELAISRRPGAGRRGRSRGGQGGGHSLLPHTIASLEYEARNTAHTRRGFVGYDARLRHKPVAFVCAGFMDPMKELEAMHHRVPSSQAVHRQGHFNGVKYKESPRDPDHTVIASVIASLADPRAAPSPEISHTEEKSLRPEGHNSADGSANHSDSSIDVVLFKGRGTRPRASIAQRAGSSLEVKQRNGDLGMAVKPLRASIPVPPQAYIKPASLTEHTPTSYQVTATEPVRGSVLATFEPQGKPVPVADAASAKVTGSEDRLALLLADTPSDEEAAMIADYIAHMDNDDEEDVDDDGEEEERSVLGTHAVRPLEDSGDSDGGAAVEELSEDAGDVGKIPSGSDNLVLCQQADSDDARDEWEDTDKTRHERKSAYKLPVVRKMAHCHSASHSADALDQYDVAGWDRTAPGKLNNASKVPDVSDPELKEAMRRTHQKSRLQKAEKKKQRDSLRSQGLLRRNADPNDLRVKYPGGMKCDDLVWELQQFLINGKEEIALPPLDKHARHTLHTVCAQLKVKSQSRGTGVSRYPVLYRTGSTGTHDQSMFNNAMRRLRKQAFYARADVKAQFVQEQKFISHTPGRENKSVTYKDGDVVGQYAAEIGVENKGRALLEKMGWSKGMALGTTDNKGIMVPISHVMKKGTAGLGET